MCPCISDSLCLSRTLSTCWSMNSNLWDNSHPTLTVNSSTTPMTRILRFLDNPRFYYHVKRIRVCPKRSTTPYIYLFRLRLKVVRLTFSKQTCCMNSWMKNRRVTFHTYITRGNSWMDHAVLRLRYVATQPAQYESADDVNRKGGWSTLNTLM